MPLSLKKQLTSQFVLKDISIHHSLTTLLENTKIQKQDVQVLSSYRRFQAIKLALDLYSVHAEVACTYDQQQGVEKACQFLIVKRAARAVF